MSASLVGSEMCIRDRCSARGLAARGTHVGGSSALWGRGLALAGLRGVGTARKRPGNDQGTVRERPGNGQGRAVEWSGNGQGAVRGRSGNGQGTVREQSGN
eukprot:2739608-Alexandrium_andersonii.AAC.1